MKKLSVDLEELAMALSSGEGGDHSWYLDTLTGKVFVFPNEILDAVEEGDVGSAWEAEELAVAEAILSSDPRYLGLLGEDWNGYQIMVDFIKTVDDASVANRLSDAIRGNGAFRRFKDTIGGSGAWLQRWYDFKKQREAQMAREWLLEQGIEAV